MGLLTEDAASFLQNRKEELVAALDIDVETIERKIAERLESRKNKDWQRSDEIRDELLEKKIVLKDSAEGTTWTVL